MKKFAIYTDYKAGKEQITDFEYQTIEANDILEVIDIADRKFNDKVYLMRIMERTGKVEKENSDWNTETYEAVLCRRSFGWHKNTKENSEEKHIAKRFFTNSKKYRLEYFSVVA